MTAVGKSVIRCLNYMAPYSSSAWDGMKPFPNDVFSPSLETDVFFYSQIQLKLCETPDCRILRQVLQTLPHCYLDKIRQGILLMPLEIMASREMEQKWSWDLGQSWSPGIGADCWFGTWQAHILSLTPVWLQAMSITSAPLFSWNLCLTLLGRKMSSLHFWQCSKLVK